VETLKQENQRLKELVAQLSLENLVLKKVWVSTHGSTLFSRQKNSKSEHCLKPRQHPDCSFPTPSFYAIGFDDVQRTMVSFYAGHREHLPRCRPAADFETLAQETVFARLPERLTTQDFEAALANLAALKDALTHQLGTFHAPGIGGRRCVEASHRLAACKLRNLLLLQPPPQPPVHRQHHAVRTPENVRGSDVLTLSDSALSLGMLILGAPGTGKTTYEALLGLQLLRWGYPTVCLDPTGTLSTALLFLLLRFLRGIPAEEYAAYWQRLRVIDVGNPDVVTLFPIYDKRQREILREVSERFIETLRLAHPG
jgi:hypothetical protein